MAGSESAQDGGSTRADAWCEIAEAAIGGDRVAYGRLVRLVNGYLIRWRAFDFRSDWDDMVQDVLMPTLEAYHEGKIPNDAAFQAFVRQTARFKFVDRIRGKKKDGEEFEEGRTEGEAVDAPWPPAEPVTERAAAIRSELAQALERLNENERAAVMEVHLHGRTYAEAAERLGRPLGTLKQDLKTGLGKLRRVLEGGSRARR